MSISQIKKFQVSNLILGALSITVAYAWSNAINSLIDQYAPTDKNQKNAWYKIFYALILTIVAGIILTMRDDIKKLF